MRNLDAYRRDFITLEQYQARLVNGETPNSIYSVSGSIPFVLVSDPNYTSGTTTSTLTSVLNPSILYTNSQSVSVKNTGSTNSLNVTVEFYVAGILSKTFTETVTPSNVFFLETSYTATEINIKVVDTIPTSTTNYEIGVVAF
jgi:hypothetical protein